MVSSAECCRDPKCIMIRVRTSRAIVPILGGLAVLMMVPRLVGIDRFATVDEPYWLTAGANFYYALGQREFANTVYDYHPAVTTMWIIAAAMLLYFPQYRGLGQGYFDVYKDSLDQFLLAHGQNALGLLVWARVIQTVFVVVLMLAIFLLLRRLFSDRAAAAAALVLSFDPFLLGHSRLLNHEALMSLLVLASELALVVYLFRDRSLLLLLFSGGAAGLAQLTKSSSIVMLPIVLALFFYAALQARRAGSHTRDGEVLRDLGIWLLAAGAVYVLIWPGMWVDPGRMLKEVFGNAFSYAFEGARLSAATTEPSFNFESRAADIGQYLFSMLWRTTPVAWIGATLGLITFVNGGRLQRLALGSAVLTGTLMLLLFGIASGRNSAHYVMVAYSGFDILAGIGLAEVANRCSATWHSPAGRVIPALLLGAAVILQGVAALRFFPYYYNYYNPWMEWMQPGRQNPNFGYGEGLDLAASLLNGRDASRDSLAVVFYGRGPFSYFYRGRTEPLKTVYQDAENVPQLQQILRRADYLVIYYAVQQGRDSPSNVMRALRGVVPETSIWINGIEYIRIYEVGSLPIGFYDQLLAN